MPRISLIIPVWNKAEYITEAIQSVKNQTIDDWELVLVDDGSTDGSLEIMNTVSDGDTRIRILSIPNSGVCQARNYGFEFISESSEYVQFPDADDVLDTRFLETMIALLDADDTITVCYCRYDSICKAGLPTETSYDQRKVSMGPLFRSQPDDISYTRLESIVSWAPMIEPACVMRRSAFERSNRWDADLGQHGEGVLLFSELALFGKVYFVNRALYYYRRHSAQHSGDIDIVQIQERKVTLKLLSCEGSPENCRRIREAVLFFEGTVRSILGIQYGWRLVQSAHLLRGLKTVFAGMLRWWFSFILPGMFLHRLEQECVEYLHKRNIDWKPAAKWRLGRAD